VVGVTNLKVVAKHGGEAIGDAVASVGFTRAEDLEAEDQFAPLYFRAALPESYLGQGGMRINSLIQRTNMSGRAWVIMVSVAVFNADIEAVRDQVDSRGHSPATVTDTLRGLTERVLKLHDQREFSSLEGVEKGAQRIAAQLGDNFEWWYAHFATAESTYDYLARSDTRTPPRNYDTGLILALQNNNQARADTFVRCMFFHEGGVRSRFETYTNVASRYRRIGEVFGVQLSLPSWDELQNANI